MNKFKLFTKKIYRNIPFKILVFNILRLLPIPHSVYQHLHFKGVIKVKVDNNSSFKIIHYGYQLENEIFWKGLLGGWEKKSMHLWIQLSKNSDVILDIGSNTGVFALVSKSLNPNAKVFAFEPVIRVFEKLQKNVFLNNMDIHTHNTAISDRDGLAVIYDIDSEHVYSVTVNKNLSDINTKVTEVEIQTISLKTFIELQSLSKIDLIKIDVETHEPEVLLGMAEYLKLFKPTLLIEVLNDDVAHKMQDILSDMDYLFFDIDEVSSPVQRKYIEKSSYYNYLICQHSIAINLGLISS